MFLLCLHPVHLFQLFYQPLIISKACCVSFSFLLMMESFRIATSTMCPSLAICYHHDFGLYLKVPQVLGMFISHHIS